jgi:catechol 2,3-dioxygenase-like lactoylglutathione lyase family enzyme
MKNRISFLTLGVHDLERAVKFYRDSLGLATDGIVGEEFEHGAVAFFDMQPGLKLALFKRDDLARDAEIPKAPPSATEFSIAHNVRTPEEVNVILLEAAKGGARIVKHAQKTFWGGYSGYFQDPDGHLWEIAWNPKMLPED